MSKEETIKVAVRIRPSELHKSKKKCLTYDFVNGCVNVATKTELRKYELNAVFGEDAKQEFIFATLCEILVNDFIEGINGTIFAYGQTGSGKTYTMIGPERKDNSFHFEERGIIPRTLEHVFSSLNDLSEKHDGKFKYSLKCSFTELYNEKFYDLLGKGDVPLQIRTSNIDSVQLQGAKEIELNDVTDGLNVIQKGWMQRKVAETAMNRESSRSHAVFMLTLETELIEEAIVNRKKSRLNLVDLAGSERQAHTLNTEQERLREAGNINKSLSVLARVIRSLANKKTNEFISFRDSMLTQLLRDSLGGNSKTAVIVNVHPNSEYIGDTLSTLNFAQNVKLIKNKAIVNENISCQNMDALKAELLKLKEELKQALSQPRIADEGEVIELKNELQRVKNMMEEYRKLYNCADLEISKLRNQKNMLRNSINFLSEQRAINSNEVLQFLENQFANIYPSCNVDNSEKEDDNVRLEVDKMKKEYDELNEKHQKCIDNVGKLEKENNELSSRLAELMCRTQKNLKSPKRIFESKVDFEEENESLHEDGESQFELTSGERKLRRQTQFSLGTSAAKVTNDEKRPTTRSKSVTSLKVTIAELEDKLEDEEKNRLEVEMELQQVKQVLADKETLVFQLQSSESEKMNELLTELNSLRSKELEAEIKLKNMITEREKWSKEKERYMKRINESDEIIARQEAKLSRTLENLTVYENRLKESEDVILSLQEDKEYLENQLAVLDINGGNEDYQEKYRALECEIASLKTVVREYQAKLVIVEKQKDDALAEAAKAAGHQNHLQKIQYLERLKSQLSNSQKEVASLKAKMKKLETAKGKENRYN